MTCRGLHQSPIIFIALEGCVCHYVVKANTFPLVCNCLFVDSVLIVVVVVVVVTVVNGSHCVDDTCPSPPAHHKAVDRNLLMLKTAKLGACSVHLLVEPFVSSHQTPLVLLSCFSVSIKRFLYLF